MIDKKRAAEICQKNAFYKEKTFVFYKDIKWIPQKLILWFDEKGNPIWSFRMIKDNQATEARICDCSELTN